MSSPFLQENNYLIDENVSFFKLTDSFKIYNEAGVEIGKVQYPTYASGWEKFISFFSPFTKYRFEIVDAQGYIIASIRRVWTWFFTTIEISLPNRGVLGYIKQNFTFFKSEFELQDAQKKPLATVTGDWAAWSFEIKHHREGNLATISKKWAGLAKEFFTSADKYVVSISETGQQLTHMRVFALAAAISIDRILKEKKKN